MNHLYSCVNPQMKPEVSENQMHNRNRKKPVICQSTFLDADEIARERAASGWNPYANEEEVRPVFRGMDYEQRLQEQQNAERDLNVLQSMYPAAAKILLPYIEEICDKMEYEGSMMFDRIPDPTTLFRMQDEIYQQVSEQFPDEERTEETDDILSMQYQGQRNAPGRNWLEDMIRVMLLQEMHHRRCRHRNCRW